jgi:hypothetical protein
MAAYTIKVQLDGEPSREQYERLHALMEELGFGRTVTGDRTVNLPHATYYGVSQTDVKAVRDGVRDSIKVRIQKNILVYVARTETWAMGW